MPVMRVTANKILAQLILPTSLVFALLSCTNAYILRRELPKYKGDPVYLHDTPITSCAKKDSILLNVETVKFPDTCELKVKSRLFIPLLFFNHSSVKMEMSLGKSSLKMPLDNFYRSAFENEAKRNACFAIVSPNDTNKHTFRLSVKIDSVSVKASYTRSKNYIYVFIGVMSVTGEQGSEALTNMYGSISLYKGDELIAFKRTTISKRLPYMHSNSLDFDVVRQDFLNQMTETLGLAIKENIETAILMVNTELK